MHRRSGAAIAAPIGTIPVALPSVALLAVLLLTGCVAAPAPDSPTKHLPLGVAETAVARCEQGVGLGGSAPVTEVWRDSVGLHVRIGAPGAARSTTDALSPIETQLLSCLEVAAGSLPPYPHDSGGLLLQWKYSTSVLWPCLVQHGMDVAPVPSRATFLRGDPLEIDPLVLVRSPVSGEHRDVITADCPLVPSYLVTQTPPPAPTRTSVFAPDAPSTAG